MYGSLLIAISGLFCLSVVLTYVLTRRYGWRFAAFMPLLALVLFMAMTWQQGGFRADGGLEAMFWVLLSTAPTFVGTGVGILLARRGRS